MLLLTKKNRKDLPALYSTESTTEDEKVAVVKFFTPWTDWTWYAVEFDGEDIFFGLVYGHEREWGYFTLKELLSMEGPGGLKIERDRYFKPTKFKDIKN